MRSVSLLRDASPLYLWVAAGTKYHSETSGSPLLTEALYAGSLVFWKDSAHLLLIHLSCISSISIVQPGAYTAAGQDWHWLPRTPLYVVSRLGWDAVSALELSI